MNILEGLKRGIAENPDKPAIIGGGLRLSFAEVGQRIDRLSSALDQLGIRRGDRVAILALNSHRYYELYFGVPQLGAAVVPINYRIPPHEVRYIIDHAGAKAVAVDDALMPLLEAIRPSLNGVEHFINIGDSDKPGYISYEALLETGSPDFVAPEVTEDELLGLFYTSGTTGEPKGVMLTHRNVEANVRNGEAVLPVTGDEVFLHAAPMFHLADGSAVFANAWRGATQAFIARFEPKAVLDLIEQERITTTVLVPTMTNFLLQEPTLADHDLSSLRRISYGASPIAPDLLRRAMEAFGCDFAQGYGLTEAAPLLTVLLPEDHIVTDERSMRRLASCGKPVPGVEVRGVREDGEDARPGEVGEIIARGPNIMAGYWQRPDDTAAAIRDGWLHTGDLATVDEDGYIYLVDRKKDMIVTGGENVFSTEVEAILYAHPAIREAAVIGIPDADWGEAVHAVLVFKDGPRPSIEELTDFCRERLANYKVPRSFEILEGELPKGGSGKILKKELREKYWSGQPRRIS